MVSLSTLVKFKDSTIPLGCALALSTTALGIYPPPLSISQVFGDPLTAWLWSLVCFVSYLIVLVGVILRHSSNDTNRGINNNRSRGEIYLFFEYPGLIAASVFTTVYGAAVMSVFGFASLIAIGFTLAIGTYFFFRWLILNRSLKVAKKNTNQK